MCAIQPAVSVSRAPNDSALPPVRDRSQCTSSEPGGAPQSSVTGPDRVRLAARSVTAVSAPGHHRVTVIGAARPGRVAADEGVGVGRYGVGPGDLALDRSLAFPGRYYQELWIEGDQAATFFRCSSAGAGRPRRWRGRRDSSSGAFRKDDHRVRLRAPHRLERTVELRAHSERRLRERDVDDGDAEPLRRGLGGVPLRRLARMIGVRQHRERPQAGSACFKSSTRFPATSRDRNVLPVRCA
jgi:hypothetical protein